MSLKAAKSEAYWSAEILVPTPFPLNSFPASKKSSLNVLKPQARTTLFNIRFYGI
jgi:hypothetical protein